MDTTSPATGQDRTNLFAAGGSVQYYPAAGPQVAYVARKTQKKPSIAFVAYNVAASAASCQSEQNSLKAAGYTVSYSDLKVSYPGSTVATDVQRMKQAGSNMVVSCMDVQGNVTMASRHPAVRAEDDPAVVQRERHVDAAAEQEPDARHLLRHFARPILCVDKALPGAQALPGPDEQVRTEVPRRTRWRLQGWESAALFVQGVRMAGNNLTQANVIATDNSLTSYTVRWPRVTDQLEVRRPQWTHATVLPRLHQGAGQQICADSEQGKERLQLLPLDQPQEESGLPVATRHTGPRLTREPNQARVDTGRQEEEWNNSSDSHYRVCRTDVRTHSVRGLPGPDLPGNGRLQLCLRRPGVRVGVHLHVPDPVPQLVGVGSFPPDGCGAGPGHENAFDRLIFRHIPNSNSTAKLVCSLALLVGIPSLLPVIFGPQNLDATTTIFPLLQPEHRLLHHRRWHLRDAGKRDLPGHHLRDRGRADPPDDPLAIHGARSADPRCGRKPTTRPARRDQRQRRGRRGLGHLQLHGRPRRRAAGSRLRRLQLEPVRHPDRDGHCGGRMGDVALNAHCRWRRGPHRCRHDRVAGLHPAGQLLEHGSRALSPRSLPSQPPC